MSVSSMNNVELYLSALHMSITQAMIKSLTVDMPVTNVTKLQKPDKNGNCCAFVRFSDKQAAVDFKNTYNNSDVFNTGTNMKVKFADVKSLKKVFIGGIATALTVEELTQMVSVYGKVLNVLIHQKRNSSPCGFVIFESEEAAKACKEALNNTMNSTGSKCYNTKLLEISEKAVRILNKKQRACDSVSEAATSATSSATSSKRSFNCAFEQQVDSDNYRQSPMPIASPMEFAPMPVIASPVQMFDCNVQMFDCNGFPMQMVPMPMFDCNGMPLQMFDNNFTSMFDPNMNLFVDPNTNLYSSN